MISPRPTPVPQTEDKDPNQPKYYILAQEALLKYAHNNYPTVALNVILVNKASEKIVSGVEINLDFFAIPTNCATNACNSLTSCHAQIWERAWLNSKDIKVDCTPLVQ